MKLFVLFLSLFPFFIFGQGQLYESSIKVVVGNGTDLPVENCKVTLFQEDSLLYTQYSDSAGTVVFHHSMDTTYTYFIRSKDSSSSFHSNSMIEFKTAYDYSLNTYKKTDFYFSINVRTCNLYNENNYVFFKAFTIDSVLKNNYNDIKAMLDEYPDMCLNIRQYRVKGETDNLVKLREKYFIKTLKELGCDMQRIQLLEGTPEEQRSKIQKEALPYFIFKITRMDGLCQ